MLLSHSLRAAIPVVQLINGVFLANQGSNATRSLTYSGHNVGDMLVAMTATRVSTPPALLSGYTNILSQGNTEGGSPRGLRLQYKIATSTSETISWSGAYGYLLALRNATRIGQSGTQNTNTVSTSVPLPTLTPLNRSGRGLILAGSVTTTSTITTVPSPYVLLNLNGTNLSQLIHSKNTAASVSGTMVYSALQVQLGYAAEFLP